jgi:hypothetical protein
MAQFFFGRRTSLIASQGILRDAERVIRMVVIAHHLSLFGHLPLKHSPDRPANPTNEGQN